MTLFTSTRGSGPVPFAEALFQGMAPDGGLFLPDEIATLDPADAPAAGRFPDTARWVARTLLRGAVEPAVLDRIVEEALDFPVPLVEVEPDVSVLELHHGPSLAFKDVGARFMARAMAALDPEPDRPRTILVATSGDTGSAVARAFHGMARYRVVVLFPGEGVSERQRRQMTTLGGNVTAVAVEGTFDDCQRLTKEAYADAGLRDAAGLTSANSINVGRLLPQAFYYVHAGLLSGWDAAPATFVVPSGNLGNLTAGLLAHRMGLPAAGFLAAANENHVFPDYLSTGRFEPRPSVRTHANAMDVGDPSNLERIRGLHGDDVERIRRNVRGAWCTDAETLECIAEVWNRTGTLLDPHTAVAYHAARKLRVQPAVVLATAHPAKFPDTVLAATGVRPDVPARLAEALAGEEWVISMKPRLDDLRRILLNGTTS